MLLFTARHNKHNNQGFTLIESLVIITIIGILSAIATPSFLALFNRSKVNDAFSQVRGALQEVQRVAIRRSGTCRVALTTGNQPKLTSNCFQIADYTIRANAPAASGATTVSVDSLPVAISNDTRLVFSGGATGIVTANAAAGSTSLTLSGGISAAITNGEIVAFRSLPNGVAMATNVTDAITFHMRGNTTFAPTSTGKIVLFMSNNSISNTKCVAISNGIGIISSGIYTPSITSLTDINSGTCNASQY